MHIDIYLYTHTQSPVRLGQASRRPGSDGAGQTGSRRQTLDVSWCYYRNMCYYHYVYYYD